MQISPNKLFSPSSTVQSEVESPPTKGYRLKTEKRFSRSKSNSRSKSKQENKGNLPSNFYVKNICLDILTDKPEAQIILSKFSLNEQPYQSKNKRASTPAKERRKVKNQVETVENLQKNLQNQLCLLKMERQLKQAISIKENLQYTNKKLEEKITVLSLQLAEAINQNHFLSNKIQHMENKETKGREGRISNAAKIKQLIIDNKNTEGVAFHNMEERLKILMADNKNLQEKLRETQLKFKQFQAKDETIKRKNDVFLQDLVQQMKGELNQKEQIIQKMLIQLNVFLVRQSKNEERNGHKNEEEIQVIKKRYINCLKKYHEVNQELAAYKRKQDRMNALFSTTPKLRKDRSGSLSISP